MGFCRMFRSKWKAEEESDAHQWTGAQKLRERLDRHGLVTRSGFTSNSIGLLDFLAMELALDATIPLANDSPPNNDSENQESVLWFVENALFAADAFGNGRLAGPLGEWNERTTARQTWHDDGWHIRRANLAAVCLGLLRDCREQSNLDEHWRRRLAWLWETLLFCTSEPYWAPPPNWMPPYWMLPDCRDAYKLLDLLDGLQPQIYDIWFPTTLVARNQSNKNTEPRSSGQETEEPRRNHEPVFDRQEPAEGGCVLSARVYLFREPEDEERKHGFNSLPRPPEGHCFVVPWSSVAITEATLTSLRGQLGSLGDDLSPKACERVMIELAPVLCSPVRSPVVHGMSLSLATALAVWAARECEILYPIAVTGEVKNGNICKVGGVAAKFVAVQRALAQTNGLRFLVPHENFDDVANGVYPFGGTLGLRHKKCLGIDVYGLPGRLADLVYLKDDLFTDGFDAYRRVLSDAIIANGWDRPLVGDAEKDAPGVYRPQDWELLDGLVASAILDGKVVTFRSVDDGESTRYGVETLPFDNEPVVAAKFVLAGLLSKVSVGANQNTLAVPLPLALSRVDALGNSKSTPADLVLSGIDAALKELGLQFLDSDRVLRTLLRGSDWSKFCLVAYAEKSTRLDYGQQASLLDRLKPLSHGESCVPTVLFLASDWHHKKFIEAHWGP